MGPEHSRYDWLKTNHAQPTLYAAFLSSAPRQRTADSYKAQPTLLSLLYYGAVLDPGSRTLGTVFGPLLKELDGQSSNSAFLHAKPALGISRCGQMFAQDPKDLVE
uniref:Uncharacterized protein n=1 Tax=Coccidioides posadasii RMSCC 3488 TaxID=454284 RepID=A0A0J6F9Q0_COCPO|nr:hypothetical protein CPAG_02020 [Coccidioides posadasii RMSCC 3488]